MNKMMCLICNMVIKRPVDHIYCIGSMNKKYVVIKQKMVSTTDITQEIKSGDY